MRLGLISATKLENGIIRRSLKKDRRGVFYTGTIGKRSAVCVSSGIGKTNASHAATLLIERYSPSLIINFGIGGAYPSSGLGTGDIAVAVKEIYGDEGLLLKDGFHTANAIGIPYLKKAGKKYFNEFPLDKSLAGKAMAILKRQIYLPIPSLASRYDSQPRGGDRGVKIKSGSFVTVSASTGTDKRALELEKRFSALCENMEGAAIAHVCSICGVTMFEIRGISNIVQDRDRKNWDIKTASENCQLAVLEFIRAI